MEARVNTLEMDEKVLEYRVATLEKQYSDMRAKLDNIEVIVLRLDSKFPAGGLLCPLHQERLNQFDKRLEIVEAEVNKIGKKIVAWSAGAAVILFLCTNLIFPYTVNNLGIHRTTPTPSVVDHSHSVTNHP